MNTQPSWLPLVRALVLLPFGIIGFIILPLLVDFVRETSGDNPFDLILNISILSSFCFFIFFFLCSLFYLFTQLLFGKWLNKWNIFWEGLYATNLIFFNAFITWGFVNTFPVISYHFIVVIWITIATIFYRSEYNSRQSLKWTKFIQNIVGFFFGFIICLYLSTSRGTNTNFSTANPSLPSNSQQLEKIDQDNADEVTEEENNDFREAVNTATKAANLAQTAQTHNEWKMVADEWKNVIASMKSVPDSDENYTIAQEKIKQYQRNLEYSQKNANSQPKTPSIKKPPEPYFQQGLDEANVAATLAQTSKSKDEWEFVASQWEKAIENMKAVSTSDVNYGKAQQRVIQYQKNLDYARLAASRAK